VMRWIILIAALLNGLVFYWFGGQQALRLSLSAAQYSFSVSEVGNLLLVTELPATDVVYLKEVTVGVEEAVEVSVVIDFSGRCVVVGPFDRKEIIDAVIEGLVGAGVESKSWDVIESEPVSYLVYLPAQRNRQSARRLAEELYDNRVESYVFEDGELKNGLSLGTFSSRKSTDNRIESLIQKGYSPLLKVKKREWSVSWIEFPVEFKWKLAEKFAQDVGLMDENAKITEKLCRAVATDK
jgi:hypothetical protein